MPKFEESQKNQLSSKETPSRCIKKFKAFEAEVKIEPQSFKVLKVIYNGYEQAEVAQQNEIEKEFAKQ